jgi:hypothetical protein
MKPRIVLLSCVLFIHFFAVDAVAGKQHPHDVPGSAPPTYQTQAGTRELPPRYSAPAGPNSAARLAWWSELMMRANAVDHAPPYAGSTSVAAEQAGPTRTSRAFAIVQIAIYDALNAIYKRYPGYSGYLPAFGDSSPDAAIAQAAHDTLVSLYPRQASQLDGWLQADLATLPPGRAKLNGVDIGRRSAAAILAVREGDGIYYGEPVVGRDISVSNAPGFWRPDPVSRIQIALGAFWNHLTPFVLQSAAQFRVPPPPPLASEAYAHAFAEVKHLGGDGIVTPTKRTLDQTEIGIYWAYDGTAWIGTPPRLYNQIALQIALRGTRDTLELARTMALVNVAIADATMAVWDSKYVYNFWRPVTAIREASAGTGPSGQGDGNPATRADVSWTPLGAPASNLVGPNFTPPFPAYPSSHAGLGGALFQMMRRLYGDDAAFTFISDELNGITRDNEGRVRPLRARSFGSLSQAEEENGQSRIYLGVHWQFDKTEGAALGHRVADYVFQRGLVRPSN